MCVGKTIVRLIAYVAPLAQNTFQIGGDGVASTVTQQSSSAQGIAAAPGLTVLAPGGAPTISANPALVRLSDAGQCVVRHSV